MDPIPEYLDIKEKSESEQVPSHPGYLEMEVEMSVISTKGLVPD